jgi:hypothetical protein
MALLDARSAIVLGALTIGLLVLLGGCAGAPGHVVTPPGVPLPRPDLTPGAIDPRVTQANIHRTICVPGYSAGVRPPKSLTDQLKRVVMRAYGITGPLSGYEGDHLIPLSLGGDPAAGGSPANFWPEPWHAIVHGEDVGAAAKDGLELYLHQQVCDGRLPLAVAQREIATNWYEAWVRAGRPTAPAADGR